LNAEPLVEPDGVRAYIVDEVNGELVLARRGGYE
jgi:hypothetical protein